MKKSIRLLSLVLCLFLLMPWAIPAAKAADAAAGNVVPDPVLRTVINQKLADIQKTTRKDDQAITKEEMALLTGGDAAAIETARDEDASSVFGLLGLSSSKMPYLPAEGNISDNPAHNHGIQSLEGLQYAVNLKSLALSDNWISDLSPLAGLKNLTYLDLHRNNISELAPLGGLTQLIHLDLYNNSIWDITPLKPLKNVTFFDLHYANRGRAHLPVEALADMTGLQYISIESNDLVNEDVECLKSLEHLNYIKLNANHITDISAISKYMQVVMAGKEKCIIEANSQSLPQRETMQITGPSAGGTVTAEIPEVLGVEEVLNAQTESGYSEGGITFTTSEGIPGITVGFGANTKEASFAFEDRKFGPPLDTIEKLMVTFSYYDFSVGSIFNYNLALPAHFQQDADYHASLTTDDLFVKIDSKSAERKSSVITGSLVTAAGAPVALDPAVKIDLKNALNGNAAAGLSASDLSVSGNTFSFRVANDGTFQGADFLTAEVTLRQSGTEKDEVIPAGVLNFHFYDGDTANFHVDTKVEFDLATLSGGNLSSLPVTAKIPGETVFFVECRDKYDNQIGSSTKNKAGDSVFTAPLNKIDSITKYWINTKKFLKPPVTVSMAYSGEDVARRFSVGTMRMGTTAAPAILFDNHTAPQTQALSVKSSDPSVVKAENGMLTAVSVGKAELTLEQVRFPMTAAGKTYDAVRYTKPLKLTVNVINAAEDDAPEKAPSQQVRITGEDNAGKDAQVTAAIPASVLQKKEDLKLSAPSLSMVLPKEAVAALPASGELTVRANMKKSETGNYIKELTLSAEKGGQSVALPQVDIAIPAERVLKPGSTALDQAALVVKVDGKILPAAFAANGTVKLSVKSGAVVTFEENKKAFVDVSENDWAAQAITFVAARELFQGTQPNRFDEALPMQRAMCWAVLERMAGQEDAAGKNWYDGARSWALHANISDGSAPLSNMTREEFMTMLWRLEGSPQAKGRMAEANFGDTAKISTFAHEAMNWAVEQKIIGGDEHKMLRAGDSLSRAEASAIVERYLTGAKQ